jgi:hypothetical protein
LKTAAVLLVALALIGALPAAAQDGARIGDASGTQAVGAQDVWGGFGINTHLDGCCNGNGGHDYNDTEGVAAALTYIGNVRLVRDFWSSDKLSRRAAVIAERTGARFIAAVSNTTADPGFAKDLAFMRAFQASCHCVIAYEGPNEPDMPYSVSLGGPFMKQGAAFMAQVKAAAVADNVKAIQMSFGTIYPDPGNYNCCGIIDNADFGNAHTYPQGAPSTLGRYKGMIDWTRHAALIPTPGRPVAHTEFGWTVPATSHYGSVSPQVQADYTLEFIFDAWRIGDPLYIYYGLYDDMSGTWGLFDANNKPRPVATALKNLSGFLADPASDARSFAPGKVNISFGNLPTGQTPLSGGQFLVMQKSDGVFWVEIQNEAIRNNVKENNADVSVPNVDVPVSFGSAMTDVTLYDPIKSMKPVQSWKNVSRLTLSLPAHPVLLEIVHPAVRR